MYTLPFEILKNKVPFLEFLWRNIKFLLKPKVETVQNFRTGESRYALWDLLTSLSLITLIYSIAYMITSDEYYQSAQRLLTQTNLIFSLGFYALPTIITFTAIIFLIFLIKMDLKSAIDSSIVCSMFFVRVYALFLLFIIPLIVFTIDLLSNEVKTINEFIENNLFLSYALLICNIAFLFWVLVHPLKVFVFPS